jgi:hypothetical protein
MRIDRAPLPKLVVDFLDLLLEEERRHQAPKKVREASKIPKRDQRHLIARTLA